MADSPQVTETKTLDGDIKTITYTTTSIYETVIPTTIHETVQLPESTTKVIEGVTVTSTSLCPVCTILYPLSPEYRLKNLASIRSLKHKLLVEKCTPSHTQQLLST